MTRPTADSDAGLAERLRFETLIADLSSKFVHLSAEEVDREIQGAQRQVCEHLGLDLAALWQWSAATPRHLTITHLYRPLGGPPLPERVDAQGLFPWCLRQVLEGRVISVSSMDALPAEAVRDRDVWRHYGIKSALVFPLSAGERELMGAVGFHTVRQERTWPEDIMKRLQIVTQIFSNALARKTADEALRQSEERFRSIAVNLPGVVYQFYARDDGRRGMNYLDGRVQEMCGLDAEPLGTFFNRFAACVDEADRDRWAASVEECIRLARPWELEFGFVKPTGEKIHLRGSSLPQRGRGEVIFSGVLRDITQLKRAEAERQRHHQELAHVNRVAALGELAGSLAHELNQPLTAILSNAQAASRFLAQEPSDLDEVREILGDIAQEGRRAGDIIQRMRGMLKKEPGRSELVDLNQVVPAVLGIMRSDLIARNVTANAALAPEPALVRGDGVQLTQVMLNLLTNACDALSTRPVAERQLTIETAPAGPGMVEVRVRDRGPGIPPEKLEQVFEPFFTTKPQGLGMGLPICRSIIGAHGGRLWAENNAHGGATFRFTLPATVTCDQRARND